MAHSPLSSMLDWLTIGLTSSWLHYLPLLCGCCSVLYLLVIAARTQIGKNHESKATRSWITKYASPLLKRRKENSGRTTDGWSVYAPVWFVAAVCSGLLSYALTHAPLRPYPVEIHYDVSIVDQVRPGTWVLSSDEPEPKRLDNFWFNCCPDFNCAPYVKSGYIVPVVKYEVREGCESIGSVGLGFFYHKPGEMWWTKLDHSKEY
jgi:hypothetical protein